MLVVFHTAVTVMYITSYVCLVLYCMRRQWWDD